MSSDIERWPPPDDPSAFESLCLELWRAIWNGAGQKHGRSGQAQYGVDIYGNFDGIIIGIQCKQSSGHVRAASRLGQLNESVEAARHFDPTLGKLIFATTSRRDERLQARAREISAQHRQCGLFEVEVWSWDDIWAELYRRRRLLRRIAGDYWPTLASIQRTGKRRAKEAKSQLIIPAFCAHCPSLSNEIRMRVTNPPLVRHNGRLQLDYFGLFVADTLLIDERAISDIDRYTDRELLLGARETLDVLCQEGFVKLVDVAGVVARHESDISSVAAHHLRDLDRWIEIGRRQWKTWKPFREPFLPLLSPDRSLLVRYPFGIASHFRSLAQRPLKRDLEHYTTIFESTQNVFNNDEEIVMKAAIRPFLEHALTSFTLLHEMGVQFTDWFDCAEYYSEIARANMGHLDKSALAKQVATCRTLFDVIVPQCLPETPKQLVRFLRSTRAIRSLRSQIRRSVEAGETLNARWADRLFRDAANARLFAGGTVHYALHGTDQFEWFYCLQKIGNSRE